MTLSWSRKLILGIASLLVAGTVAAMDINKLPPDNWKVPSRSTGVHTATDVTFPSAFTGVTPCRLVDTRGTGGVPINTGGPFAANEFRTWTFTGLCGIPVGAASVSLNITVTSTGGETAFGFVKVWPGGGVEPNVSTLNWSTAGVTESNAAIVPLSGAGTISLRSGNNSSQVIVDTNGYFLDSGSTVPTGESLGLTGTRTGFPIVFGVQLATGSAFAGTSGVGGRMDTAGNLGAGVVGFNLSLTAVNYGVFGSINSTATDAAAVYGTTNGTTGRIYGVFGHTSSATNSSAGVRGEDSTGSLTNSFWSSSGVLGQGENGVLGYTSAGGGVAVIGAGLTTSGTALVTGFLGDEFLANHGVWAFLGDIGCTSCTKAFVDPHPTDASKEIRFISLEGNEAGTYFRGTAETVGRTFVIQVPEDFRLVTDPEGLTVQLTPIGAPATMYIESEDLNQIVVHASRDVKFHYLVNGIRATFKDAKTIIDAVDFLPQTPDGRMPDGWAELAKQRLIANGTYNKDGTLNMETAERLGWAQKYREMEEAKIRAAKSQPNPPPGWAGGNAN